MQHVFVCMWFWSFNVNPFFLWCVDFLAFFHCEKAHGEAGVTMCGANSPSVSCVSVQSSNTSERVRRPQSDAISEYVYSGVNQNLNRPYLPHGFPVFFFKIWFFSPFVTVFVILPWNILVRRTLYLLFWGCQRVSRQGIRQWLGRAHIGSFNWKQLAH